MGGRLAGRRSAAGGASCKQGWEYRSGAGESPQLGLCAAEGSWLLECTSVAAGSHHGCKAVRPGSEVRLGACRSIAEGASYRGARWCRPVTEERAARGLLTCTFGAAISCHWCTHRGGGQ